VSSWTPTLAGKPLSPFCTPSPSSAHTKSPIWAKAGGIMSKSMP
jgi:hypothetical protein